MSTAAKMIGSQRLKQRAFSLGVAKSFDYAMQFLLPVVLARCLDSVTFGEYRLVWLAVGTVMLLAPLNMPQSLYYFLPRSDARMRRLYINHTLAFLGLSGLIAAWAVSPWNPWLPEAIRPLTRYGGILPVFVALWVTAFMLDMLPATEERVGWQAKSAIALSLLRVAMLSLGALYAGSLEVLLWLMLAHVLIKLGVLGVYIARFHGFGRPVLERETFVGHFKHAAPIGVSISLFGLRGQADQWIAAHLFALSSFAAFSIAAMLGSVVNIFRGSVVEAFLPSMSRMQAAGDLRGMLEMNSRANVMIGTLLFPLLAFIFVFAEDIVTVIYTATYVAAAPVMRVHILGLAVTVIEMGSIVLLLRQGPFALRVNVFTLMLSVAVSYECALYFGLPGAAVGSVSMLYFDRVIMLRRISAHTGIAFRKLQHWRELGVAVLYAGVSAALAWAVAQAYFAAAWPLARLAAGGVVLALAYAGIPALIALRRKPA
jgi:O-antigen/teichoic acid export membrane protein